MSANAGDKEIEHILALERMCKSHEQHLLELEQKLLSQSVADIADVQLQIEEEKEQIGKLSRTMKRRKARLGIQQRQNLDRVRGDIYLQLRMNALAVKTRIRDRIRQRKFELERLECGYRQTVNGKSRQFNACITNMLYRA